MEIPLGDIGSSKSDEELKQMPFIQMYLIKGCTDEQYELCAQKLTEAVANNLEVTLPRMVRVTFNEISESYMSVDGEDKDTIAPTLILQLGPNRSDAATAACMRDAIEAVHESFDVPKEKIRFYVHHLPGENFAIGGVKKNFNEKVK